LDIGVESMYSLNFYVLLFKSLEESLEQKRNSSLLLTHFNNKSNAYVFLCIILLAVKMVADVTQTCNVIPSLGFKL